MFLPNTPRLITLKHNRKRLLPFVASPWGCRPSAVGQLQALDQEAGTETSQQSN